MSQLLEDPSLLEGFVEIYQAEKLFKVNNKITDFEDTLMVRVFKSQRKYKIELTSENNVGFLYQLLADEAKFEEIAKKNALSIGYIAFLDWLKHIFTEDFSYQFLILSQSQSQLNIFKQEKFKLYSLASLPFEKAPEEEIRESITYRYNRMKIRKQMLIEYWEKMVKIIKVKNPSLYFSIESEKKSKKVFK